MDRNCRNHINIDTQKLKIIEIKAETGQKIIEIGRRNDPNYFHTPEGLSLIFWESY